MKRTYNEIMHDIYNTDCLKALNDCREEIKKDKYTFTLNQLRFAVEGLMIKSKEIARKDAQIFKRIIGID